MVPTVLASRLPHPLRICARINTYSKISPSLVHAPLVAQNAAQASRQLGRCNSTSSSNTPSVSPDSLQRAEQYIDLVLEVNKVMNLTGIRDKAEAMERHVNDSLALLPVIEAALGAEVANKEIR